MMRQRVAEQQGADEGMWMMSGRRDRDDAASRDWRGPSWCPMAHRVMKFRWLDR
jgi:hypothetical protein